MTAMRRLLVVGGLMAGSMFLAPAASFASDFYNPPAQIPGHAQCDSGAVSGAFGALGRLYNMAGGANGYATGVANSGVCGHRSGNL